MLGTNVGSLDAVQYAQSQGYRVIVTDNYSESYGAKAIADEVASISTRDVLALVEFARDEHISGVFTGVSEDSIRSALDVSEALDLPFYCTREQWDQLMDKERFRTLSIESGVPSPATYFVGDAQATPIDISTVVLPCIVKPVDGSALSGISVCRTHDELPQAIAQAIATSRRGAIVIEEFVEGDEFTAAYVVKDGVASLSSIDDRHPFTAPGITTTFPILRVYPSRHLDEFISTCDESVHELVRRVGLSNACLYVQGIRTPNRIVIFEAGLRLAGEAPYRFLEIVNGVNPLHHLVHASFGKASDYDLTKDDPQLGGKACAILSFIGKPGRVASIIGFEETLESITHIVDSEVRYKEGDQIRADGTLRQIVARFILVCKTRKQLRAVIEEINSRVDFLDDTGTSLVEKFDSTQL